MWERYYTVGSIDDALDILEKEGSSARLIAGGTDIVLELKKGIHPDVKALVDINRIGDLGRIEAIGDQISIGSLVTHNQCLISNALFEYGIPLIKAAASVWGASDTQCRDDCR